MTPSAESLLVLASELLERLNRTFVELAHGHEHAARKQIMAVSTAIDAHFLGRPKKARKAAL